MRAAAVAIAALLAAPAFAHDRWANGDPIPAWIKSSCCGPADVHHLTPDQVQDMGDYYIVDGYHQPIMKAYAGQPNNSIIPSQDGDYWIFYKDDKAHDDQCPYQGCKLVHVPAAQSSVYCFFIPMAI